MIIYTMKVIFVKCLILMCVLFLYQNVKNVKVYLMVNVKLTTSSAKCVMKTHKYFSKGSFYSFKTKVWSLLIYIVSLRIIQRFHLLQITLITLKLQSFAINFTNQLGLLYLT